MTSATVARPGAGLPLRWRVTLAVALSAVLVVGAVGVTTFVLARGYLLDRRTESATQQAFVNARLARDLLRIDPADPGAVAEAFGADPSFQVLLRVGEEWFTSGVSVDPAELPAGLLSIASSGGAGRQRVPFADGAALAVAVPLGTSGSLFVEVVPLSELDRTLELLRTSLVSASALAAVAAAGLGWLSGRRLSRPLRRLSDTATRITDGDLSERLDGGRDPDVTPLVDAFNAMLDSVQARIDRDARFSSEVSHELRTPLTTLATATELATARLDELPEAQRRAWEIVRTQVASFQRLVLDLLELARLESGADPVRWEPVDLAGVVASAARRAGGAATELTGSGPWIVLTDPQRLERVVANLLDNASRHAGGVVRLGLRRSGDHAELTFDDAGPGLTDDEQSRMFERFWRGASARRSGTSGSGLGLSIVAQQLGLLGGEVRYELRPEGGSRFVVRLPWRDDA